MRVFIVIRMIDDLGAELFKFKNSYEKKVDVLHKFKFSTRYHVKDAIEIERNEADNIEISIEGKSKVIKDAVQYYVIGEDNKILFPITISNTLKKSIHVQRMTKRNLINFYITLKELSPNEYIIFDEFSVIEPTDLP